MEMSFVSIKARIAEDQSDERRQSARRPVAVEGIMRELGASGVEAKILNISERGFMAASEAQFGAPCGFIGQGGTIPLMSMLQESFPRAQMMVCGVLGPKSNAHGPNEFLHVSYGKRLTAAVAQVMAACP